MRKLFKILKRCQNDIEDIQAQISRVETLPYYTIFGSEGEQEKDLETCYSCLEITNREYYTHLENLQIEIEKEKHRVSQQQKRLTLRKVQ